MLWLKLVRFIHRLLSAPSFSSAFLVMFVKHSATMAQIVRGGSADQTACSTTRLRKCVLPLNQPDASQSGCWTEMQIRSPPTSRAPAILKEFLLP